MLGEGEAGVPIEIHLSNVQTSQNHVSFPKLFQLYGHGVSHGRPKFGGWTLYLCWNDRHLTQASNGLTKQEEMATFPIAFEMSFSARKLFWEVPERNSPHNVPEWFKGLYSVFKRRQVIARGCWESLFQVNWNKLPLVYRDGISLCLDLLMIITLGTKAHILDPKCQELMFPLRLVCMYACLLSQGERQGWRCSGGAGSGGNLLTELSQCAGCSDTTEINKITLSHQAHRAYLTLSYPQEL